RVLFRSVGIRAAHRGQEDRIPARAIRRQVLAMEDERLAGSAAREDGLVGIRHVGLAAGVVPCPRTRKGSGSGSLVQTLRRCPHQAGNREWIHSRCASHGVADTDDASGGDSSQTGFTCAASQAPAPGSIAPFCSLEHADRSGHMKLYASVAFATGALALV